jgi:methionine-rich copper-binding protein CopC
MRPFSAWCALGRVIVPVIGALVVGVSSASAHAPPVRFEPAPGAVLSAAPLRITGWFSSGLAITSFLRVSDEQDHRVDLDEVELAANRQQISVALPSGLAPGRYLVFWRSVDGQDGEPVAGCYAFFVGQAAADAALAAGLPLDGGGSCPANAGNSSGATVKVSVPANLTSRDVPVQITTTNFTLRPAGEASPDGNGGHFHLYLDQVPTDVLTGHGHSDGTSMNDVMWYRNSYTFENLAPGVHTATVVLFRDDHTPFQPPVMDSTTFTVPGAPDGAVPVWWLPVAGLVGVVLGGVGLALLRRRGSLSFRTSSSY